MAATFLAFRGFFRMTADRRLWPSIGLFAVLEAAAFGFEFTGARAPAIVLWCACAITAMERLPLSVAVPCSTVALGAYAVVSHDNWMATVATTAGLGLAGYVVRLDAEARGNAQRLLAQERAARKAEAESAALTERGRIAREIHDVLAHSLSAQLVHLEAARLLIQRSTDLEADRDQLLDRVVACRGMAREGLDGTREALSALRGEMIPVEEFLRSLTAAEGVRLEVRGEGRALPGRGGTRGPQSGPGGTDERTQARPRGPGGRTAGVRAGRRRARSARLRRPRQARRARGQRLRIRSARDAGARRTPRRNAGFRPRRGGFRGAAAGACVTTRTATRVVVADDQTVVREGIVMLLGLLPGIEVVGSAADGADAVRLVAQLAPDVVLMDLRMPRCDGVEATRRIRAEHPGTQVVVLTTYADDDSLFPALQAGARGYLTKDADGDEIVRAIDDVLSGDAGLSPRSSAGCWSASRSPYVHCRNCRTCSRTA